MVCPGRGTASPATGRSGVERDCRAHERPCSARAARSGRHGGQQAVRQAWPSVGTYCIPGCNRIGHQANISLDARPRAACGTTEPTGKAMLPEYTIRSLRLRCVLRTCHPFRITVSTNTHRSRRFRGSLLRVGRNSKRYRRHHPASPPWSRLAGTYPYNSKQSNPASCAATRLQLRCNPGSHRNVRTRLGIPPNPLRVHIVARVLRVCHRHAAAGDDFLGLRFFPSNLHFGGADGDAPV